MTKKVTVTLAQDGTGNNKLKDLPQGTHTNVARLHEMVEANYSFDISEHNKDFVTSNLENVIDKDLEGNKAALETFLSKGEELSPGDTPLHLKIYQDGVGSGPDGLRTDIEGGTGTGTAARVFTLKQIIADIRVAYGDDVEIDLNAIGFSRGSVAIKQLLNELSEEYPNGEVHINNVLLFDPVASMGNALTDTHIGNNFQSPSGVDSETRIAEFYAANEYRSTFSSTAYQSEGVMRQILPGAHSQIGGGYKSDILAAGPLAQGLNFLSGGDNGLKFDELPMDDIIRMRLYNAVVESPALLKILITDSRISSEGVLDPGTDNFPFEWSQDYQFDEPVGHRGIVDERFSLSQDPFTGAVIDGYNTLFNQNDSGSSSYLEMMGKIYFSNMTIDSIAALQYQKIILPDNIETLPVEIVNALSDFELAISVLSEKLTEAKKSSENPLTDSELLQLAKDEFQEISGDFWLQAGESPAANIASKYVDGIGNQLGKSQAELALEEIELAAARELAKEKEMRAAELDFMDSGIDLRDAIESGDGVTIAREGIGYISSLDDYADAHYDDDNSETEDGFLGHSAEAVFDGMEHTIGLGQAIDDGDGWDIAGNSADLLLDINRYVDLNDGTTSHGFLGNDGTAIFNMASSGLALAEALEDGDGWGIAQSTTQLLESINTYTNLPPAEILQVDASATDSLGDVAGSDLGSTTGRVLQGAGSAVGLAANLASFEDVWESGDAVRIGYTTASTVNNAINTYNAIAGASNAISGLGCVGGIPVLSWVTAGVQLVQGDVKGAAVTIATAYLMAAGPWGWAAAAVLQIANMLGAFGEDDPLSATADFALDANGNVIMALGGDDEMKETASSYANPLVAIMQGYKNQGGRVEIDGSLPSLRVEAGSDSEIRYTSEYGGEVVMSVGDPSRMALEMRGVLYARDRGDRIDDAIKIARDSQGNIDFSMVDAHLAAMGFTKKGMTYTYGESTAPRIGQTFGNGVLHGGGNADGPEGKLFVAQEQNISSLPLRPDQLPSQKIGELLRSVSLKHNFAGAGGILLAMGLGLDVDQACAIALLGQVEVAETNGDYSKPLGWLDRNLSEQETLSTENLAKEDESSELADLSDEQELHSFLHSHWPGLVSGFDPLEDMSGTSVLNFEDPLDDTPLSANLNRLPWWNESGDDNWYNPPLPENPGGLSSLPITNIRISEEQLPEGFVTVPLAAGVVQGSCFLMAQDSSLRFLDTALTEDLLQASSYSSSAESYELVSFGNALNGTIYTEANGDIRFVADAGFVGTASFDYTLLSPAGDTISSQALIVVEDVNDPPQLVEDHFVLNEGDQFFLDQLLNNDTDIDGDTLTIDHLRGLDHGEISFVDNRLVFTPDEGFVGDLDFTYWAYDRVGSYPQMGEASLTFLDQNLGVSTTDDAFITLEDQSLVTTVDKLLSNDLEYDGESIHFVGVQDAVHGQVSVAGDGTITFVPDPDYAGTEAGFSYTVEDDSGNLSTGWAGIDVLDLREPPVVSATTLSAISEDETITFTPEEIARFVTDPDGDLLHLDYITNIVGGSVEVVNGFYRFIPEAEFSGTASFDYQANDSHRGTVEGHLEFDILPVNDPVEIGEDFFQTGEETPLLITVSELLANDQDPEGTEVEFVSIGAASHGTVTVDSAGMITFSPETDYQGEEAGFDYVVRDGAGQESTGFVQIQVDNVNDAPKIISNSMSIVEDQAIVFDTATVEKIIKDVDGDTLELSSITNVNGGVITEESGIYTFTPDSDYHGQAFLDYTASDGNGGTVSGSLDIEILSQNDQTEFGDDSLVTSEEITVTTTVAELMANDVDADGELAFVSLGAARYGDVSLAPDGTISFNPETDYQGEEAGFEYVVRDAEGGESTTFVSVQVNNVNDAPEVIANSLTTVEDQAIVFDATTVETFLKDVDGDILELTSIENVNGGVVTEENGVYSFIPDSNYHGSASLDYTASDGNGGTVSGSLDIEILSQNDQTDFGDDTLVTAEEVAVSTSVAELMVNDVDADGALSFVSLGTIYHGSITLDAQGSIEFLPEKDYFGSEAGFEYLVEDAEGNLATGLVRVDVENINDLPQVVFDRLQISEDQEISFTSEEIAGFIHDPDNDLLNFTALSAVVGGSFRAANGIYIFTPDTDYYGEASFDYTVGDNNGGEVSGTMKIDIAPVNDLPTLPALSGTMIEDGEITFSVATLMAGAVDVEDGTDLRFTGIVDSLYGDAWVDDDDLLHFLPDTNFFGTASFSYSVSDSEAGIGTASVTVTVIGENDTPVAVDDERILAWSNNSYDNVYSSSILLANDYDVDLDSLEIISLGQAEYGSVSLDVNGNIHYQAQTDNWVGVDSFTYTIDDGNGAQAQAVARVDVKLNTSPDAYSEILFSQEDVIGLIGQEELLGNDSDVDGDILFISAVGSAEHGSVTLLADGRIQFTPELNFNNNYPGQASFEYTISDGISDPVTAVAFLDLDPVNDAPILQGERISGAVEDNSFSFTAAQLMINDSDVEMESVYENDSIAFVGLAGADHGSLVYDSVTDTGYYTPDANFCGVETFRYQVTDSYGMISTGVSEIYVQPVNDNPVAQEDIGSPAETYIWNKYSIAGLLGNDFDVDGDSLSLVNPYVSEGSANIMVSNGYLWVQPAGGEDRVDVSYTVSDGNGGTAPSRLIIDQITEHNFAPTFTGRYSVEQESSWEIWFTFEAVDLNGGNTWSGDYGDIVTITPSQVQGGNVLFSTTNNPGFAFKFEGDFSQGALVLTVADYQGATGSIYIEISHLGRPDGIYTYSPVVFDLDGDGVELLGIEAGIAFDWNRDGTVESSGWVAPDDGFLVYDYDQDSLVTKADELMLREYLPGAATDLEGLRAFDSNEDGIFTAEDDAWGDFGVWQDTNSNGITDEGEFHSLEQLEIRAVELESDQNVEDIAGNTVYGSALYHREDGSTGEIGDVALRGEDMVFTEEGATEFDVGAMAEVNSDVIADTLENETLEFEPLSDIDVSGAVSEVASDLSFDEAEISRIAQQLQSDAAAGFLETDLDQVTSVDTYLFDAAEGDSFQADDVEEELLAFA